jgi:hypothetical protein
VPTLYWGPWLARIRRGGPVMHLEKLEKIFFQVGKKIVLLGTILFLVQKIFFSFFPHEKTGKVKTYSVTIIVLAFYCLNNLF